MICKTMRLVETSGEKERLRERERERWGGRGVGNRVETDRRTGRNKYREELGTLWHSGGAGDQQRKTEVGERQRLDAWEVKEEMVSKVCCMGWNPG